MSDKPTNTLTKAQETKQRIDALVAEGSSKAEAFRTVAGENGQPVDSIRGSYYAATRKSGGKSGASSSRTRRETTAEDAIESAVAALRQAIDSIEVEVSAARTRAEEHRLLYEQLKVSATQRIEVIEAKIAALTSDQPAPAEAEKTVTAKASTGGAASARKTATPAKTEEATPDA